MRPAPAISFRVAPALAGLALACLASAPALHAAAPPAPAARAVVSSVPADIPSDLIGDSLSASVTVRALVAPSGLVDSATAVAGDERLRAAAEAAVRWWVFAPARAASWASVNVPFEGRDDDEPLRPDVLALARDAEAGGDDAGALAALSGALARLGRSPAVNNEWSVRERALAMTRRRSALFPPGDALTGAAQSARGEQLRAVTRVDHAALVTRFDQVLAAAPWWDEPYLWRAGSLAGTGRVADALRSLRAFRLGTRDSEAAAFAGRMIDRLAAADTLGVNAAIKTWRVPADPPPNH
jgi:hypothetical protein